MDKEAIYREAIKFFGIMNQLEMVVEECTELIDAIQKLKRGRGTRNMVLEELSDVEIMLEQARLIFGGDGIERIKKRKIKRLKKMIENGGRRI